MENPLLMDMAIHHFDQMRYLLGCNPLRVWARSYNPSWSWFKGDAVADVIIEFEGDIQVSYHGSWVARGYETTWDGNWKIECALGGINWANNEVVFVPREIFNSVFNPGMFERDGKMVVELVPMEYEDRAYSLFEFYQAITLDRDPETSGKDNLYTLALTFGAIKSAQVGGWVYIDEIMAQK
jgi:predicted dehydrogenase